MPEEARQETRCSHCAAQTQESEEPGMNMQIILRQLDTDDFGKMLKVCKSSRERFYLEAARINPNFEYHIDLPGPDGPTEPIDMQTWLADPKRFPDD